MYFKIPCAIFLSMTFKIPCAESKLNFVFELLYELFEWDLVDGSPPKLLPVHLKGRNGFHAMRCTRSFTGNVCACHDGSGASESGGFT